MGDLEVEWPPRPIATSRLVLRAAEARDRSAYLELFPSPSVWTYLGGARSREELERLVPRIPGNHPGIFVVELGGELAGTIVLDRRDPQRPGHIRDDGNELEVSYTFLQHCWGSGYASEAVEAALSWAATTLTDHNVVLCTQVANERSMRLAQRLGFDEVARFEEFGAEQWLGRKTLATEQLLTGGNASGAVVRIGDTVRKPWTANTPAVNAYVEFLRAHDIDAPRTLGRDGSGRQMLEYIDGREAQDELPLDSRTLRDVGALVRRIHDVSAQFDIADLDGTALLLPVENADLMCHNDLAPWNLILGSRLTFIDWDGAGPSTRLWDLAYSAQSFGMLNGGEPVSDAAERLRAFVDGYDADAALRARLPDAMAARTRAMFDLLERSHVSGAQPWADMFVEGHGEFWSAASAYVADNRAAWQRALAL